MWRLLKAELQYYKIDLILGLSFGLIGMIANVITGWQNPEIDLPGVRSLMAMGTVFACFLRLFKYAQDKKDRQHATLPLPVRQVGVLRLLYIIIIWLGLVVLFWICSSTIRPYRVDTIIWETLSLTGFIFMANAILFIHRDLYLSLSRRYQKAGLMAAYSFIIVLGYVLFYFIFAVSIPYFKFLRQLDPFKDNFKTIASSPYAILLSNVLGIGFSIMSVVIYERRRSYIE